MYIFGPHKVLEYALESIGHVGCDHFPGGTEEVHDDPE